MNRRTYTSPMSLYLLLLFSFYALFIWLLISLNLGNISGLALLLLSLFLIPRFANVLSEWISRYATAPPREPGSRRSRRQNRRQDVWSNVILPDASKRDLMTLQRILEDPKGYKRRWGMEPPLGAVLHGPPGTGKTLIARTLAQSAGYAFLAPSPAELSNKWVGDSEKAIHALYDEARASAPCVIFLDELDALASERSSSGSDSGGAVRAYNNATNQLLQEIDGFQSNSQIFTIGATNRLDILDAAITSRLGMHVHIGLPDTDALVRLFRIYTWPYRERLEVSAEILAYSASGMSGRDVQEISKLAAMSAEGKGRETVGVEEFSEAFSRRSFSFARSQSQPQRAYAQQVN